METKITNTIAIFLFILLVFPTCHSTPDVQAHPIHDTVLKFIPHRAPDSAYLGRYEETKGPFMMPKGPGSKDSVLIEDHQWHLDSGLHNYISSAHGYLHSRGKDGKVEDIPIIIEETNKYDTLKTQFPASRHLPIAKAPTSKQLPDSVHAVSKTTEEETKAFWRKLRHVKLPYTYRASDELEFTILTRKVSTESHRDTIYLNTFLTATAKFIHSNQPAEPITMQETEPVE